jgi:hypothetical protein
MTDFSMTKQTPEEAPTVREIGICGGMTIHHADDIRMTLLDTLAEANEVRLDLKKLTEIDLVGLQLICSAHRTAMNDRKLFVVKGGDNSAVKSAALAGGYIRHVGCAGDVDQTCIWSGGGN